jgi:8-oxo-dGTP pyrophosphatase MutT (NUDIX family)
MILSAGIVVVRKAGDRWTFLLLRAFRNWDFPKGEVEPGESPLAAALRETREEAGLAVLDFKWGTVFQETAPYNRGTKTARYYLAETRQEAVVFAVNPALGGPEHHEYRWLDREELERLAPARLKPVVAWAARMVGA